MLLSPSLAYLSPFLQVPQVCLLSSSLRYCCLFSLFYLFSVWYKHPKPRLAKVATRTGFWKAHTLTGEMNLPGSRRSRTRVPLGSQSKAVAILSRENDQIGPPWVRNRTLNSQSHRDHAGYIRQRKISRGNQDAGTKRKGGDVELSATIPHVISCHHPSFSPSWLRKIRKVLVHEVALKPGCEGQTGFQQTEKTTGREAHARWQSQGDQGVEVGMHKAQAAGRALWMGSRQ